MRSAPCVANGSRMMPKVCDWIMASVRNASVSSVKSWRPMPMPGKRWAGTKYAGSMGEAGGAAHRATVSAVRNILQWIKPPLSRALPVDLLFCGQGMQPKLHAQTQTLNPDGAAVVLECQIDVTLQVEGGEETTEQLGAVVALPNVFRRIIEPAVADQKIEAAARQIERMHAGGAAGGEGCGGDIVLPLPLCTLHRYAAAG